MVIQTVFFLLKLVPLEMCIKTSSSLCFLLEGVCEDQKLVLLGLVATRATPFDMPRKKFLNLILLLLWIESYKSQRCSTGVYKKC